ncbi:MAG: metallophosphoesterase family protein [Gemmatimonadaceae bacterium]
MTVTSVFHVSDLHFGQPAVPAQIDAIAMLIQEQKYDIVAISGDVSQRARSGEFQRARAFLRHAEEVSRTIVVPGNHDVAWWKAPLGFGDGKARYANYRAYVSPDLEPVLRVPGATFIGINTAHGVTRHTLTWRLRDISIIGYVNRAQIERMSREFDASPPGDRRIIVMHHNPVKGELSKRHGLKNTRKVLGAFAENAVDVVLCGHDHQEAIHYIEHTRRGTVISTAGTVSNRSRGGRPSSVNIIRMAERSIDVSTLIWAADSQSFVAGRSRRFED